jgi:uncharacterized membrane protein YdfJ with MMPL/SSD domain
MVDAFLARATLVPAFMKLAGRANWWTSAPLRRLHDRFASNFTWHRYSPPDHARTHARGPRSMVAPDVTPREIDDADRA